MINMIAYKVCFRQINPQGGFKKINKNVLFIECNAAAISFLLLIRREAEEAAGQLLMKCHGQTHRHTPVMDTISRAFLEGRERQNNNQYYC